jgi:hypothetical protein
MKFRQIIGTILISLSGIVIAQDCIFYYPETEGTELVYQHFDKKGNPSSKSSQKVTVYKQTANGAEAEIAVKMYDEKGELVSENELQVRCEAGVFYFDMSGYLNQEMMSAYESMEVKVNTDNLEMPSKLKVGETLKDGSITIEISSSGMKLMTIEVAVTNRNVLSEENVTTAAGTFRCYKITQTVTTKMGMQMVVKSTDWLSPGTGMVKSESYSDSDKPMGKSELIKINR